MGIQSISLTVTGASSGNGTFTESDFATAIWSTNGGTLDLSTELVGQPTNVDPWGSATFGAGGDFNLFAASAPTPSGTLFFQLTTAAGAGDNMQMTSFAPSASAAPEPASLALAGMGVLALAAVARRRNA